MTPPKLLWGRLRGSEGQALTEYALLYVFVVLAIMLILGVFGAQIRDTYQNIVDALTEIFT